SACLARCSATIARCSQVTDCVELTPGVSTCTVGTTAGSAAGSGAEPVIEVGATITVYDEGVLNARSGATGSMRPGFRERQLLCLHTIQPHTTNQTAEPSRTTVQTGAKP